MDGRTDEQKLAYYQELYERANRVIGELTPLKVDCGQLCGGACCRGDEQTGMLLFPHEQTVLKVLETPEGRLAVCDGSCDRSCRPLACRIFPFFPVIDEKGAVRAVPDPRAFSLCPIAAHSRQVLFDTRFIRAVREVGRLLYEDPVCRSFLQEISAEIRILQGLYEKRKPGKKTDS